MIWINALILGLLVSGEQSEAPPKKNVRVPSETLRQEAIKLYGSALILEREGRIGEALKTLEVSMVLNPDARLPKRASIQMYLRLQKPFDALEQLKDLLESNPEDLETIHVLSQINFRLLPDKKEVARLIQLIVDGKALVDDFKMKTAFLVDLAGLYEEALEEEKAVITSRKVVEALKVKNAADWMEIPQKEVNRMLLEATSKLLRHEISKKNLREANRLLLDCAEVDKLQAQSMGFSLAKAYAEDKKYDLAMPLLNDFIEMKPSGVEAYELRAQIQKALGLQKEILKSLDESLAQDPRNIRLRQLTAREYQNAGREKEAQQVMQLASFNQPQMKEDPRPGSFAFEKNHGPKAIIAKLDSIFQPYQLQVYPPPDPAQNQAFLEELRSDEPCSREVVAEGKSWLKNNKSLQPNTLMYLGILARDLGDDGAFEAFFMELPKCTGTRVDSFEKEVIKSLYVLADALEYPTMARLGEAYLANPKEMVPAILHAEIGYAYAQMGNREKALYHIGKSLSSIPKEQSGEGILPVNAEVLNKAENLTPEMIAICRRMELYILSGLGDFDKALQRARDGLRDYHGKPQEMSFRDIMGQIYYQAGKYSEAEELVQKAMVLDPNNPIYCNQLGYHWADLNKNLDEAEVLIRKALDLEQTKKERSSPLEIQRGNIHYLDSLGWVLFRKGKLEQAKTELEKVMALPNGKINPEVLGHLAQVYEAMGETQKALLYYQKAISRQTSHRAPRDPALLTQLQTKLESLEAKARGK